MLAAAFLQIPPLHGDQYVRPWRVELDLWEQFFIITDVLKILFLSILALLNVGLYFFFK